MLKKIQIKKIISYICFVFPCLTGCVCDPGNSYDPWEPMNRSIFQFNQVLDTTLLRPVASGYRTIMPDFLKTSVSNVFDTIEQPMYLLNAVLQIEPKDAGIIIARTGINLTFGFFGLFDVASDMGIPRPDNDFGQTLAKWGWKTGGPYVMLPLLGPSNVRDTIGLGVDAISPVAWELRHEKALLLGAEVLGAIDVRSDKLDLLDNMQSSSTDYYAAMRTMYQQNRQKKINQVLPKSPEDTADYEFDFEIED